MKIPNVLYPVLIIPVYQRGRNKKYKRTKKSLTLRACCWTRLRQLWWTSWWGWDCVCGADAPGLCTFPLKLRERWASDDDPTDVSEEGRTIGDARVEIEVTSEVVNVGVDWTVRDNVEIKNIYIAAFWNDCQNMSLHLVSCVTFEKALHFICQEIFLPCLYGEIFMVSYITKSCDHSLSLSIQHMPHWSTMHKSMPVYLNKVCWCCWSGSASWAHPLPRPLCCCHSCCSRWWWWHQCDPLKWSFVPSCCLMH